MLVGNRGRLYPEARARSGATAPALMSEHFQLTRGRYGETPALRVTGPLVFGEALARIHDVVAGIASQGYSRVVIDVAGVEHADSSGLSALLDVTRVIGGRGAQGVVLLRPPARLVAALALIRVTSQFEVLRDRS